MLSDTAVVNAMTSCFTSRSISRIRATSNRACSRSNRAASAGTSPRSASTSAAASSTSSQPRNLFSSLQMRPISGRVYRGIIGLELKDFRLSPRLGDYQVREQLPTLQRLPRDQPDKFRVVVVLAQMAEHQHRS